ncbi:TetR/AcrR family transcriptional regulator [Nonomuraea gerenzanensis]|uniref:Transcriptional regulator, TetR family n=1 Tax=Nonomuraea gerenzanensis TaxID=93944 RepID=A0A1M4E0A6_9ACTN|nr:TetR/AcrR family transcriptional regulator [Nonomuraea gerenzanensis]UBU14518.1 TetR/AcrR family transcriptional regulator [Nonomuraea gerenzanensis]SBO92234.1 Transcriptional regulator, TetR family [Nonomuraea gerenzanensis]
MIQDLTDRDTDAGLRIRTAAVLLFARQGYAATGIRDLGKAVNLTNAGIYHHVTSKEALLADLMRVAQRGLIASTERLLAPHRRPADRLSLLISSLTAVHARNPMTTRVMDGELRSLTPGSAALDEIIALRDAYEAHWKDALADGVAEGSFHVADERLTRLALMSMCTGTSEWYRPDGRSTLEQVCAEFVAIGLAAVRAPSGTPVATADLSLLPEYPWEPLDDRDDPRPDEARR